MLFALSGRYTRQKCEDSCSLKERWLKCGVIPYVYRNYYRNKEELKRLLNDTVDPTSMKKCYRANLRRRRGKIWDRIEACRKTCYQPCAEDQFRVTEMRYDLREINKKPMIKLAINYRFVQRFQMHAFLWVTRLPSLELEILAKNQASLNNCPATFRLVLQNLIATLGSDEKSSCLKKLVIIFCTTSQTR